MIKDIYIPGYNNYTDKVLKPEGFLPSDAVEFEPFVSDSGEGDSILDGNGYFNGVGIGTTNLVTNFDVLGTSYISESLGIGTTNSGTCGKLEVIGTICATNFNSTSDIKFKTDIKPIENPLQLVNNMNGVHFKWIENENYSYGFIAQELEKITPELVGTGNYKTVNYSGVIPILVESIKELQSQITELKSEIQKLQSCSLYR